MDVWVCCLYLLVWVHGLLAWVMVDLAVLCWCFAVRLVLIVLSVIVSFCFVHIEL